MSTAPSMADARGGVGVVGCPPHPKYALVNEDCLVDARIRYDAMYRAQRSAAV